MPKNSGLTIIELVAALCMFAILAAMAAPSAVSWVPNYRLKSVARGLVADFQRARLEAIKRNRDVVITFFPQSYTPNGGRGRYVLSVDDAPRNGSYDMGETVLAAQSMPRYVSLYQASFGGGVPSAGFNSRGLPLASSWGTVHVRNNKSRYYRVSMSSTGHVRLQISSNGSDWI